jgi:uncharacterized protein YbjT (DUF2867 family)
MIAQKKKFAEADRKAARNMVDAAASEDLERIIYLGGLAEAQDSALSKHLQSRIEVANILQAGPVPTTDLRAPMILGSGSASFALPGRASTVDDYTALGLFAQSTDCYPQCGPLSGGVSGAR